MEGGLNFLSALHLWPGLFRVKPTQFCAEVVFLASLASQGLREDVTRASDSVMPRYSMRSIGRDAVLHDTDSFMVVLAEHVRGSLEAWVSIS